MGAWSRWLGFLTVFFCIYGSFHLYVLIKVRRALYLEKLSYFLLLVVLAFLMLAPIQARILSVQGFPTLATALTWLGYVWMGYVFLFVCLAAPIDLYHLIVAGLQQLLNRDYTAFMMLRRQNLVLVAVTTGGLMMYGAYSAYLVRPEHITLHSAKIPASVPKLRIVQITDLHLGLMLYPGRLGPIVNAIKAAQPDILVSTGDFIDGPLRNAAELAQTFRALPAPLGKFAVTGNHEAYMGTEQAMAFTESAGFHPLRGTVVPIKDLIVIAGVDDPATKPETTTDEAVLLKTVPQDKFTLLLKHRPVIDPSSLGLFDLQLSGHTHKGQIFPFNFIVRLFYPMIDGLYSVGPQSRMYASRGTGTWGPPVRLLSAPEITVIDLLPTAGIPGSDESR